MGIIILPVVIIYLLLSVSITIFALKKIKNKIIKYTVISLVFLLPFWDMIIHTPVYCILSSTVPEITRYQPYKKVEGFYEDFIPRGNIAYNMFFHDTFEKKYSLYFDKTGKYNKKKKSREKLYYKAFWLNDSTSPTCFKPQPSTVEAKYLEYIKNNWCISVEQIEKNEMTRYWKLTQKKVFHFPLAYMNIYVVDFYVSDRFTDERIIKFRDVFVDKSWMTAINGVSGKKRIRSGTKYTHASGGNRFIFPDYNIIKILDSEELPQL